MPVPHDPLRALAARNLADWHEVSVRALGVRSERWPSAWVSDGLAPRMYFTAVVTERVTGTGRARLVRRLETHFASSAQPVDLCDPFQQLDLGSLGFSQSRLDRWLVRRPGGEPTPAPPGLEIREVRDTDGLLEFEAATVAGFEVQVPVPPFSLHAPAVFNDPRFRLWLGRAQGKTVSVAMAYVGDELTGVYGVATVPAARRHGYGEALTWVATLAAPDRPAVLQPSAMAESTYRRMGYVPFAEFAVWTRDGRAH